MHGERYFFLLLVGDLSHNSLAYFLMNTIHTRMVDMSCEFLLKLLRT